MDTTIVEREKPPTRSPLIPRFSLQTLVLATIIVALAAGLYSSKQRNDRLQDRNDDLELQNKEYRSELGLFEIEDPTKIHVIRLPDVDGAPRRYRVYLPPGRKYHQYYRSNRIPEFEIPKGFNDETLEPGNYLFSISVKRNKGSGDNEGYATFVINRERTDEERWSRAMTNVALSERDNDWIVNDETKDMTYSWKEPARELRLQDPDKPLVLYRARAEEIVVIDRSDTGKAMTWSTKSIDGPCDGFMLWIEPEEPEVPEPAEP